MDLIFSNSLCFNLSKYNYPISFTILSVEKNPTRLEAFGNI